MFSGALISLGLPTLFDLRSDHGAAQFGLYSVVVNLVSIFNMVMITGTLQAVSKIVSETPERGGVVVRRALKLQLLVGVPVSVGFLVAAPLFASALNDPALTPFLRLSGGILLAYCFYAIFVGYFNGKKLFTRQATLDIAFASLKVCLLLGAVYFGFGVMGAIGGFVLTAVIVTTGSAVWVGRTIRAERAEAPSPSTHDASAEAHDLKRLLGFMLSIMAYTFFLNAILRADLFILKWASGVDTSLFGGGASGGDELSNQLAGVYSAMQNVARLPYQAVIAITFVVFPIVSRATFEGDADAAKLYIRQTGRYSLLLVGAMVSVLIADRGSLLAALYPAEYAPGAAALLWLALAMMCFALMYVGTTILISAARPVRAGSIATLTLTASVVLALWMVDGAEVGFGMLERVALATFLGTAIGLAASILVLAHDFRAVVPPLTVLRVLVAGALVVFISGLAPLESLFEAISSRLVRLGIVGVKMAVFGVLFYALIYVFREFGEADKKRLRAVLRRK